MTRTAPRPLITRHTLILHVYKQSDCLQPIIVWAVCRLSSMQEQRQSAGHVPSRSPRASRTTSYPSWVRPRPVSSVISSRLARARSSKHSGNHDLGCTCIVVLGMPFWTERVCKRTSQVVQMLPSQIRQYSTQQQGRSKTRDGGCQHTAHVQEASGRRHING